MSKPSVFGAVFSSVLCTLITFTTSSGQESASLPDLGVEMAIPASGDRRISLTPETAASGELIRPDWVEPHYLLPLRWELEKHRLYQDLMREELASLEEERQQAIAQQEQLVSELMSLGTMTLKQLDEKHLSLQAAKLEAAILEAESAALRDAIGQRKERIAGEGREKYDEAIDLQKKLIEVAEKKKEKVMRLVESGTAMITDVSEADAQVIGARRELALMEAEAIQKTDPIVDAILGRLAELEPHQKATAAKTERLSELTANAGQIRQLIHESRQVERKLDLLEERKNRLGTRLREQNLRTKYLEEILKRYESSLKKATTASQREKDE